MPEVIGQSEGEGDDHECAVRLAAGDKRGAAGHVEVVDSMNPQIRINDAGGGIGGHPRRTRLMIPAALSRTGVLQWIARVVFQPTTPMLSQMIVPDGVSPDDAGEVGVLKAVMDPQAGHA
jgi:hypothetical protein